MKCLIVIDYQNDFVSDNGKLTAGEPAQCLENYIYNKVSEYIKNNDKVLFTLDTHTKESWSSHPESQKFELHCEKGTKGWNLYGKLNEYMNTDNKNICFTEKSAYCPSFDIIENIVKTMDSIEVVGVVTDICVLQTAIGLYTAKVNLNKNTDISVDLNGCASFNQEGHKWAVNYMKDILSVIK